MPSPILNCAENDRAQTRQFVTMQRGLAIETDSAVVMAAHPSLTGIATDTGLSGTTGWHNSVRARMYLKAAPGDDHALRVLEMKKSNYGPVTESILLRWRDGVYVVEPGKGTLERLAAEAEIDHLFMKLLRRFAEQGRNVSDKVSPSYAPSVFTAEPEAKVAKASKKAVAEAMARLFAAGKIRVEPFGPASKMRSKIVETEGLSNAPFQRPSNHLPTTSQRGVRPHPPTPPARWKGQRGRWKRPRPCQRERRGRRTRDVDMSQPDNAITRLKRHRERQRRHRLRQREHEAVARGG